MLDWVIEVLQIYHQKEQTIFRAFFLLDFYLWKSPQRVPAKKLHLLGAVCLMLASKNQEIQYIHTSQVVKNIAYDKFTKEEILETEREVLKAIDFRVNMPTLWDLCLCGFRFVRFQDKKVENFFRNSTLLVVKTCLFSVEVLDNFSHHEIAGLSMIMVLKMVDKISPGENIDVFAKLLVRQFKLDKQNLVSKLQFLTEFTLNFDSLFPYVVNLKKYFSTSYQ